MRYPNAKKVAIICNYCGRRALKKECQVNRAKREGMNLYCGMKCSGASRRVNRTDRETKAIRRKYYIENRERIKAMKAASYDPDKFRAKRERKHKWYLQYCKKKEIKMSPENYDRARVLPKVLADGHFGDFKEGARKNHFTEIHLTKLNIRGLLERQDDIRNLTQKQGGTLSHNRAYRNYIAFRDIAVALAGEERILESLQAYRDAA